MVSHNQIRCLAIVQARLGSSRLPDKIFKTIKGKPAIWHVLRRLRESKNLDHIVLAIPDKPSDDSLADYAACIGMDCFRGSMDDVLDRYWQTAKKYSPEALVRITSDNTLLDPYLLDFVINAFWDGRFDYISNSLIPSFPDGLDVEVMKMTTLKQAWKSASTIPEREHVTAFIRTNPEKFKTANVFNPNNISHFCWALDTPEDLKFLRSVFTHIDCDKPDDFRFQRVLEVCELYPELNAINSSSARDHKLVAEIPGIFADKSKTVRTVIWD